LSGPSPGIDRRAARRRFDRAAETYARASRLESEVAARMDERLDYMKIAPRRILDAASGPPGRSLGKRYPGAEVIALDFSLAMLRSGSGFGGFFRKKPLAVCADLERLPIAAEEVELVWCNMALHWLADPLPALREFARVLAAEGLLMFSTLGPDALKELRAAAGPSRVHGFIDMHDIGDMLVAAGFTAPVMDMEMIRFEYGGQKSLLADLRASGQTNARADRPRGLHGRRFHERLNSALGASATFEVVYGHAWKARAPVHDAKTIRVFKRMP
jgi:malonyl-CoA O-methyltransferase